uniref:Uncharacterized protein n=1 Tax=Hyaloperonospora arabidopsidis (strain Emoy2) TaxID=559515 RepID=M4BKS6_HYAAE
MHSGSETSQKRLLFFWILRSPWITRWRSPSNTVCCGPKNKCCSLCCASSRSCAFRCSLLMTEGRMAHALSLPSDGTLRRKTLGSEKSDMGTRRGERESGRHAADGLMRMGASEGGVKLATLDAGRTKWVTWRRLRKWIRCLGGERLKDRVWQTLGVGPESVSHAG